jgi:hypothetical protein
VQLDDVTDAISSNFKFNGYSPSITWHKAAGRNSKARRTHVFRAYLVENVEMRILPIVTHVNYPGHTQIRANAY